MRFLLQAIRLLTNKRDARTTLAKGTSVGIHENTIICFWGDHGFHLGDKQVWGRHTNYEQATVAPLILSAPSIPSGVGEDTAMTELVDIFPTRFFRSVFGRGGFRTLENCASWLHVLLPRDTASSQNEVDAVF